MPAYIEYMTISDATFNMSGKKISEDNITGVPFLVRGGTSILEPIMVIDSELSYDDAPNSKIQEAVFELALTLVEEQPHLLDSYAESLDMDELDEYLRDFSWDMEMMFPPHTPEAYREQAEWQLNQVETAIDKYAEGLPVKLSELSFAGRMWNSVPSGAEPFVAPKLARAYQSLYKEIHDLHDSSKEAIGALLLTISAYLRTVING